MRRGEVWWGRVRRGQAGCGKAWHGMESEVVSGLIGRGLARSGEVRCGEARHGMESPVVGGLTRLGTVW